MIFDWSSQTTRAPAESIASPYEFATFALWDVNFPLMRSNFHLMGAPTKLLVAELRYVLAATAG